MCTKGCSPKGCLGSWTMSLPAGLPGTGPVSSPHIPMAEGLLSRRNADGPSQPPHALSSHRPGGGWRLAGKAATRGRTRKHTPGALSEKEERTRPMTLHQPRHPHFAVLFLPHQSPQGPYRVGTDISLQTKDEPPKEKKRVALRPEPSRCPRGPLGRGRRGRRSSGCPTHTRQVALLSPLPVGILEAELCVAEKDPWHAGCLLA